MAGHRNRRCAPWQKPGISQSIPSLNQFESIWICSKFLLPGSASWFRWRCTPCRGVCVVVQASLWLSLRRHSKESANSYQKMSINELSALNFEKVLPLVSWIWHSGAVDASGCWSDILTLPRLSAPWHRRKLSRLRLSWLLPRWRTARGFAVQH